MHIETLALHHDRESFTCGEPEVNDFLRLEAMSENYGQTWVVTASPGQSHIMAFYTINPDPITGVQDNEYNEYPIGLITLEMLGVDTQYQRQQIGTHLLLRVIRQTLLTANRYSINGLLLTALHQQAKDWYLRRNLGFREAAPGSMHLLLPVATMRMLPGIDALDTPL